eukprot:Skav231290  [mRNA]  locus=scaffold161:198288:208892:+ [translate_table: standard]
MGESSRRSFEVFDSHDSNCDVNFELRARMSSGVHWLCKSCSERMRSLLDLQLTDACKLRSPPVTDPNLVITVFTFGLRTFGFMNTDYNIDVVAHPTNVWKIGIPGTDCEQFTPPHIGTTCRLRSFQGALASEANGFRLDIGTTPMINLGSQATPQFSLVIQNPPQSVNMRWICPIADTAPFKETTYGVRLKVVNPSEPGAARSWRVELWEEDATKPVAATRGIRGMEVSGPMQAALSQENQLLGSINTVRFDITPQQPIGNVPNTRLRVIAGVPTPTPLSLSSVKLAAGSL